MLSLSLSSTDDTSRDTTHERNPERLYTNLKLAVAQPLPLSHICASSWWLSLASQALRLRHELAGGACVELPLS